MRGNKAQEGAGFASVLKNNCKKGGGKKFGKSIFFPLIIIKANKKLISNFSFRESYQR